MEGDAVGFLKYASVVSVRSKLGSDKGAGSVVSGGSFYGDWVGNLEDGSE